MRFLAWHVDYFKCGITERGRSPLVEEYDDPETVADNAEFYQADAENLPIGDGIIDIALVNGIFNLNPKRDAIFLDLARVVRPGGTVYAAELVLKEPLLPEIQESEANWFA